MVGAVVVCSSLRSLQPSPNEMVKVRASSPPQLLPAWEKLFLSSAEALEVSRNHFFFLTGRTVMSYTSAQHRMDVSADTFEAGPGH
jgi:hypothetical protein